MSDMKLITVYLIMFFIIALQSCDCDCSDEMDEIRSKYGEPEEVSTYSSSGYKSESWWYWSKGVNYDFTWGSDVEGCCDKSQYTFDPIKNIELVNADSIKNTIRIDSRTFRGYNEILY